MSTFFSNGDGCCNGDDPATGGDDAKPSEGGSEAPTTPAEGGSEAPKA